MPNSTFPIQGVVKDVDGTTPLTSGDVYITNFTKSEQMHVPISAIGEYDANLATLTTQWVKGDVLYVEVFAQSKNACVRAIIGDADQLWNCNIFMKEGETYNRDGISKCRLISLVGATTVNTAYTVNIIERYTDRLAAVMNVLGTNNANMIFSDGYRGKDCQGGVRILWSASLFNKNTQPTGIANAYGDNVTNANRFIICVAKYT